MKNIFRDQAAGQSWQAQLKQDIADGKDISYGEFLFKSEKFGQGIEDHIQADARAQITEIVAYLEKEKVNPPTPAFLDKIVSHFITDENYEETRSTFSDSLALAKRLQELEGDASKKEKIRNCRAGQKGIVVALEKLYPECKKDIMVQKFRTHIRILFRVGKKTYIMEPGVSVLTEDEDIPQVKGSEIITFQQVVETKAGLHQNTIIGSTIDPRIITDEILSPGESTKNLDRFGAPGENSRLRTEDEMKAEHRKNALLMHIPKHLQGVIELTLLDDKKHYTAADLWNSKGIYIGDYEPTDQYAGISLPREAIDDETIDQVKQFLKELPQKKAVKTVGLNIQKIDRLEYDDSSQEKLLHLPANILYLTVEGRQFPRTLVDALNDKNNHTRYAVTIGNNFDISKLSDEPDRYKCIIDLDDNFLSQVEPNLTGRNADREKIFEFLNKITELKRKGYPIILNYTNVFRILNFDPELIYNDANLLSFFENMHQRYVHNSPFGFFEGYMEIYEKLKSGEALKSHPDVAERLLKLIKASAHKTIKLGRQAATTDEIKKVQNFLGSNPN